MRQNYVFSHRAGTKSAVFISGCSFSFKKTANQLLIKRPTNWPERDYSTKKSFFVQAIFAMLEYLIMEKSVNQLVSFFVPEHYNLRLDIDRIGRVFNGTVKIKGEQVGDEIRLHAKDLEISHASVNGVTAKATEYDNDEICFEGLSLKQKVEIEIEFTGWIIDGSMHGLYPCHYKLNGKSKELLATQFESHHAREVFPCVDEPAAKATFDLTLVTETGVTVLSNMPIKDQKNISQTQPTPFRDESVSSEISESHLRRSAPRAFENFNQETNSGKGEASRSEKYFPDKLETIFQTTPKMSTYLLAFAIGDLQKKTAQTKSGVEVNVYSTPAQKPESLDFALDVATKCIDFYDEYFEVEYPLPKSDHIALPDFSSGAMENWGLITYRESCLLAEEKAGLASKQNIATVITHELSHQWFGNLVTMKWWNDLWLNESFASLMEHIATDALFPDWQMWLDFETSDVIAALRRDALPGVQSVRQDVRHPDEISTLFDSAIVYAKGERLLKMCRAFIGEKNFRAGLSNYFQKFAYQNTEANDLWRCFDEASGANAIGIADLMTPWLTQPHYPVVTAKYNETTKEITLTQETFLMGKVAKDDTIWPIPLFSSDPDTPQIFDGRTVTFKTKDVDNFQLNVGNNAHFIAKLDGSLRKSTIASMGNLDETDRLKILNEITLLTRAGHAATEDYFEVLPQIKSEKFWAIQEILSLMASDLKKFVENDEDAESNLKKMINDLAEGLFEELGVQPKSTDSLNVTKLRPIILSNMFYAENQTAIEACAMEFNGHRDNLAEITGDLRAIIIATAIRFGAEENFGFLMDLYKNTHDADLKQDICAGLAATRQTQQIQELVANLTTAEVVRPQDIFHWFSWLLANRYARGHVWAWCRGSWDWIEQTFSGDKSFDMFPQYLGNRLQTRAELAEFDEFFGSKKDPALQRAIAVGHSDILARVEWLERDREAVLARLK